MVEGYGYTQKKNVHYIPGTGEPIGQNKELEDFY